ncbi:hypothetical protein V4B17_04125 [Bartonella sp. B23]
MLFLHLSCKKENFLSFTAWILLSSFGILLTNNLGTRAYSIKQSQADNIVETNTLDSQNKRNQLNAKTTKNKKLVTLHKDSVLPLSILQNISMLDLFLITTTFVCSELENLQTQYFSDKRAPPFA